MVKKLDCLTTNQIKPLFCFVLFFFFFFLKKKLKYFSLLGTWSGESSESWRGADSSLLQIALSLQGLVLGDAEPYYLEAGYERQRGTEEGARNARRYAESALVLVTRHLTHVVARCVQDILFERRVKAAAGGNAARDNNNNSNCDDDDDDDDDDGDGGVFGFRQQLRAHFRARGAALLQRLRACTHDSDQYSRGFQVTIAPLVARLERAMSTLLRMLEAAADGASTTAN